MFYIAWNLIILHKCSNLFCKVIGFIKLGTPWVFAVQQEAQVLLDFLSLLLTR
uniref:Uncharacterized protein n=1 Tax=Anguilla anguilla TaxID=7936 RepID=A0A0E9WIK0_ANGAN